MIVIEIKIHTFFYVLFSIINRHFLPFGRADLATAAALRPVRGGRPQLHEPRLASAAISTRE